jgi:hypothetical protein
MKRKKRKRERKRKEHNERSGTRLKAAFKLKKPRRITSHWACPHITEEPKNFEELEAVSIPKVKSIDIPEEQ